MGAGPAGEQQRDLFAKATTCPRCGRDVSMERTPNGDFDLGYIQRTYRDEVSYWRAVDCWTGKCGRRG